MVLCIPKVNDGSGAHPDDGRREQDVDTSDPSHDLREERKV